MNQKLRIQEVAPHKPKCQPEERSDEGSTNRWQRVFDRTSPRATELVLASTQVTKKMGITGTICPSKGVRQDSNPLTK